MRKLIRVRDIGTTKLIYNLAFQVQHKKHCEKEHETAGNCLKKKVWSWLSISMKWFNINHCDRKVWFSKSHGRHILAQLVSRLQDVETAFLGDGRIEDKYIERPKVFVREFRPNLVFKLWKTLYGFKHAPRQWYTKISCCLCKNINFEDSWIDLCIYVGKTNSEACSSPLCRWPTHCCRLKTLCIAIINRNC